MEIESFAKLFLAHWIIEHFDIVKGIADPAKERIDIWLDEKKQAPTDYYAEHEVIAYGFTKEWTTKLYLQKKFGSPHDAEQLCHYRKLLR